MWTLTTADSGRGCGKSTTRFVIRQAGPPQPDTTSAKANSPHASEAPRRRSPRREGPCRTFDAAAIDPGRKAANDDIRNDRITTAARRPERGENDCIAGGQGVSCLKMPAPIADPRRRLDGGSTAARRRLDGGSTADDRCPFSAVGERRKNRRPAIARLVPCVFISGGAEPGRSG